MPTIKNERVESVLVGLTQLSQRRLPVAGALRVRKVTRAVQEHWDDLQAIRMELIKQYCKKGEDGQPVPTQSNGQVTFEFESEEARQAFMTEWSELMQQEFTHPYGIEEAHLGNDDIEPNVLIGLDEFLVEAEDAEISAPPA